MFATRAVVRPDRRLPEAVTTTAELGTCKCPHLTDFVWESGYTVRHKWSLALHKAQAAGFAGGLAGEH